MLLKTPQDLGPGRLHVEELLCWERKTRGLLGNGRVWLTGMLEVEILNPKSPVSAGAPSDWTWGPSLKAKNPTGLSSVWRPHLK